MIEALTFLKLSQAAATLGFAALLMAIVSPTDHRGNIGRQVLCGLILGGVGILSMLDPVIVQDMRFDARMPAVVIAAPLAGPFGGLTAAVAIAGMRIAGGGAGLLPGLATIALGAAIGFAYWRYVLDRGKIHFSYTGVWHLGLACALVPVAGLVLLPDRQSMLAVLSLAVPLTAVINALGIVLVGMIVVGDRQRRHGLAALQESEERLRTVTENVPGAVFRCILDHAGRPAFPFISTGASVLTGISAEQITREPDCLLSHIEDKDGRRWLDELRRSAREGTPFVFEGRWRRPDGSVVWLLSRATPQTSEDGTVSWDGFVLDITDKRTLEDALEQARAAAEAANHAKTRFVGLVSHELRSPLSAVLGYAALLKDSGAKLTDERHRGFIESIERSAMHIAAMVDDLIDLSAAESGVITLRPEAVEMGALLADVAAILSQRADDAGVRLQVRSQAGLILHADEKRLRQVLINLITNAIRFTPQGGEIRVIAACTPRGGVTISVADTGIGIAPADQARILEPFVQVDNEINRRGGGTGLGLPLSKRLVEAHGGTLAIESDVGQGTTVTISLPRTIAGGVALERLPPSPHRAMPAPDRPDPDRAAAEPVPASPAPPTERPQIPAAPRV